MAKNDQSKKVDLMSTKDMAEEQMEGLQRSLAASDETASKRKE